MVLKNHWKFVKDIDLSGHTLIIPSVATGNVGQLTCDLVISSLGMNLLASVYTPAQIPVFGSDPYDLTSTSFSSSCQLYVSSSHKLIVLQIRAPLIYKYAQEFLEHLVNEFKERKIRDIIILTSSYAHEKKHIMSSPFRYLSSEVTPYREKIDYFKLMLHESHNDSLKIFGGGYASMLYKIIKEKGLPCLVLYKYCSEGDNIPDSYDMIGCLNNIYPLFDEQDDIYGKLVQPASWTLLFGRPPPQDIY
ncbi:proteasome assembly chaperone 2 [Leptidea sinapis]|uniref:proteasome assembly chaperone 2 n=1 Tax=Leptidea sinapis TaxID=189913 RepID=UPI0021C38262|nr:proteasome assembly chaperone 2 [Leptidea sinapis]